MSSREVLRKQNDVVISKSSELRLPQLILSFAMTIKKTFSTILMFKQIILHQLKINFKEKNIINQIFTRKNKPEKNLPE